ncbi:HAD-IIB family hydrolase [Desulfallas sp. Bu1-1]|uniref:HAD-IIB family hydrolase n=1 Tax=Desulfallas sp. Bu1-1 TaxID=2787620 RepID=UPI001FAD26E6|nr:HAD-IIB family hydrolase [Desulfallas sp. Bu1-1]
MNPGAGKGAALAAVAGYYGIDRENIIAVGDSYNDLDMIEYAGRSGWRWPTPGMR